MMKKTIILLILVLPVLFSACDKTEQGNLAKDIRNPVSTVTLNEVGILKGTLNDISNKIFTHDERVEKTIKFVENLAGFLQMKESTKLSDEDLQKVLDDNIIAKTNVHNIDTYTIRLVRFDGLPELFGTLERKWTYLQWWNDKEVCSQIIINKGAEVTDDFLITKVKDIPTVTLAGYLTMYKPFPVFLSTWQLKDGKWKEVNLFSSSVVSNGIWDVKVIENTMIIESKNKEELTVELSQQKNEVKVYSEADHDNKIGLKFQDEQIVKQ